MLQLPPLHAAVPFCVLQTTPQPPQLVVVMLTFVSQPLATIPSQLPYPELHAMPQLPPVQEGVPLTELQALPQTPQCEVLLDRLTSQPLFALPSQFPYPRLQTMPQLSPVQFAVPFVELHAFPQAPQFAGELSSSVSQPFARLPSQLPQPGLHPMPQTPAVQLGVPLAELQTLPQMPQLPTSSDSDCSQPSEASPLQLPQPVSQTIWHAPFVHCGLPWIALQILPQPPQWIGLACVLISQPLPGAPSQSA